MPVTMRWKTLFGRGKKGILLVVAEGSTGRAALSYRRRVLIRMTPAEPRRP